MSPCIDVGELVGVGAAVGWEVDRLIEHLQACDGCRTELRELATVRIALTAEVEPRPGFIDEVMGALGPASTFDSRAERRTGLLGSVASFSVTAILAGGTAILAVATVSSASAPVGLPTMVLAATIASLGAGSWSVFSHRQAEAR